MTDTNFITRTIESQHYPGVYLRVDGNGITTFAQSGTGRVSIGHGAGPAEQFKLAKAPADGSAYITSIEALNYPGICIRMDANGLEKKIFPHGDGHVNLQFGSGGYEKFNVVNNSDKSVSFESTEFPGFFLSIHLHEQTGQTHPKINCQYGAGPNEKFELKEIPAEMNIRILTYNVHLMEDSFLEMGAKAKRTSGSLEAPVVFEDVARRELIVHKTVATLADVICFQEIWNLDWEKWMTARMKETYPYSSLGGAAPHRHLPILATSGLVMLSKFELSEDYTAKFGGMDSTEGLSEKGVLCVTAAIPPIGKIRIGTAHASSDTGGDACRDLELLAEHTVKHKQEHKTMAAICLGDFNAHPDKYPVQKKIFTFPNSDLYAAMDCGRVFFEGGDKWKTEGRTIDMAHNRLDQFFSTQRNTAPPSVIDYIWAKQGTDIALTPKKVTIPRDWNYNSKKWYWAHFAQSTTNASTAWSGDLLCVVYTELNTEGIFPRHEVYSAVFDKRTKKWTHSETGFKTSAGPGVVFFEGKFRIFYRHYVRGNEKANAILVRSSTDGLTWVNETYIGHDTGGSVSPVVFKNKLYVFHVDSDGEGGQIRYVTKLKNDEKWEKGNFSGHEYIHINTSRDMSVAVLGDQLCVVSKDGDGNAIMCSVLKRSGGWYPARAHEYSTKASPAIVSSEGKFHLFFIDSKGNAIFRASSGDGINWNERSPINTGHEHAMSGVAAAACGDNIMLFYGTTGRTHCFEPSTLTHTEVDTDPHKNNGVSVDLSDHYPVLVDIGIRKRKVQLNVTVYLKDIGNLLFTDGQWAGAKAEEIPIEGIQIDPKIEGLTLRYRVKFSGSNETAWSKQGEFIGAPGQRKITGFTIELTDDSIKKYKLSYRAAIEFIGPTRFYSAGEYCGTDKDQFIDAIWLQLEKK